MESGCIMQPSLPGTALAINFHEFNRSEFLSSFTLKPKMCIILEFNLYVHPLSGFVFKIYKLFLINKKEFLFSHFHVLKHSSLRLGTFFGNRCDRVIKFEFILFCYIMYRTMEENKNSLESRNCIGGSVFCCPVLTAIMPISTLAS